MIMVWFILDMLLKFLVGVALVCLAWAPFGIFGGMPVRPWLIAGMILGVLVNGFFELSDVFGLKRLLGIDD